MARMKWTAAPANGTGRDRRVFPRVALRRAGQSIELTPGEARALSQQLAASAVLAEDAAGRKPKRLSRLPTRLHRKVWNRYAEMAEEMDPDDALWFALEACLDDFVTLVRREG